MHSQPNALVERGADITIHWTRMRSGFQSVKGDPTIWVMRSGTEWCAGIRGLAPEPGKTYLCSRDAREAVERYMAAGLHRRPYSERLAEARYA